jgi:mannan endo-1,4-beta-mannosidase
MGRASPPALVEAHVINGLVIPQGSGLVLNGRPFTFVGFDLYGANSSWTTPWGQCGYNWNDDTNLREALDDQGPLSNTLRAWFFQIFATDNGVRDWSRIDKTLSVIAGTGKKVIVTLADQWNYCEGPYKGGTWYGGDYATEVLPNELTPYRTWVTEMVTRYRDHGEILMWQLMNEAENADGGSALFDWAQDVSALIKSIDPNHLVNIGTIGTGQPGTGGNAYSTLYTLPTVDVCEYHDYGNGVDYPGTGSDSLGADFSSCAALGKPIFAGESGVTDAGTLANRAALFKAKLAAQLDGGAQGFLIWDWATASDPNGYDVGPGDPLVTLL